MFAYTRSCHNHTYLNSLMTASTSHSLVGVGGDSGGASHLNVVCWRSQRLVLRSSRLQSSSRVSKAEHAAAEAAEDAQNNGGNDDDKQHYPTSNGHNKPAERWEYLVRLGWKRIYLIIRSHVQARAHTHTHTHTHTQQTNATGLSYHSYYIMFSQSVMFHTTVNS